MEKYIKLFIEETLIYMQMYVSMSRVAILQKSIGTIRHSHEYLQTVNKKGAGM